MDGAVFAVVLAVMVGECEVGWIGGVGRWEEGCLGWDVVVVGRRREGMWWLWVGGMVRGVGMSGMGRRGG